jgi:hypothetical protein
MNIWNIWNNYCNCNGNLLFSMHIKSEVQGEKKGNKYSNIYSNIYSYVIAHIRKNNWLHKERNSSSL